MLPYICKVCTPQLPELKGFADLKKSHSDLKKKVEDMESGYANRFKALELSLEELTKASKEQTTATTNLGSTLSEIKAQEYPALFTENPPQSFLQMLTKHVTPTLKPMINTEISERDQIEQIKHNLIISGMAESDVPGQDAANVMKLIKDEMNLIVKVETTSRIPRKEESDTPRLLRAVFDDMKVRKSILSKAVTLRESQNEQVKKGVFIRPELTKTQLEESKNLTTTLRAMRQANPTKKYKIYRGKIIEIKLIAIDQVQE